MPKWVSIFLNPSQEPDHWFDFAVFTWDFSHSHSFNKYLLRACCVPISVQSTGGQHWGGRGGPSLGCERAGRGCLVITIWSHHPGRHFLGATHGLRRENEKWRSKGSWGGFYGTVREALKGAATWRFWKRALQAGGMGKDVRGRGLCGRSPAQGWWDGRRVGHREEGHWGAHSGEGQAPGLGGSGPVHACRLDSAYAHPMRGPFH